MKLYQLTTTAIITLVSILGNPLESFSQKKFFIPSALAQNSWVNNPYRVEITEKMSDREIRSFLSHLELLIEVSEADKKAIIEDLEKIESLKKSTPETNSVICRVYKFVEAWEKAIKACERSLRGGYAFAYSYIDEAYVRTKKYNKAINSLKKYIRTFEGGDYFIFLERIYMRLGFIYFQLGDYAEAIRQYQKAVEVIE
ncbi:lipopolysaccharide assembly protein LapB [Okeania sp. SIO2B3]|uniref:tetratricopeptide repeat protein n=1 Tax=Okeania sp. SIO2B3 TaxID=2607784 RepID=UPI0013C04334|nr:tetratricopeptide repeat protein [Okeania sp. SIO2B3]NET46405.1 tetratricopeptide repeat protein [Okeania sp. SIO2B3]